MSNFNVVPKDAPALANSQAPQPQSARDRAIAKFTQATVNQSQQAPVPNASQISPEDMTGAIPTASSQDANTPVEASSEAPAESPKPSTESPKDEPLSAQYAQLARKEKAMRAQAQALKSQLETLKAQEVAIKEREAKYTSALSLEERLAKDPLSVLQEKGFTYEQLTQMVLNQASQSPGDHAVQSEIAALKAEIQALRTGQDEVKNSYQEEQQRNYKQAVNQIRTEVKSLVSSDPAFEMIASTQSEGDVVELIEKTFKEDGVLLTVEQAAKEIEDYLTEEAFRLAKAKKIQSRLAPAPSPAPAKQAPADPTKQPLKTLTNSVTASRPLTARERAIAAFKGQLKQ